MRRFVIALSLLFASPAAAQDGGPIPKLEAAREAFLRSLPVPLGSNPWLRRSPPEGLGRTATLRAYDQAITSAREWMVKANGVDLLKRKGLWIRPYARDLSNLDILEVMDNAQRLGITDVFVETFWGGKLIFGGNPTFDSRYGEDLLATYVEEGHRRGMKVHAWLHTLDFGPDWARMKPDTLEIDGFGNLSGQVERGSNIVSPALPEVRVELRRIVEEVATRSADGVMLDYLRYPTRMRGEDIDDTPDPRNFFGFNLRQLTGIQLRHAELDTPEFRRFLREGVPTFDEQRDVFLERWKTAMSEDLEGLIDSLRLASGRMALGAAYFPDYYFHRNDTRVQESRRWAGRFDLLSPMCYQYYLDDYPAPFGTYTINRALEIADDTVSHLDGAEPKPLLLPSFSADPPGSPLEAPLHHRTLREQTAYLKGLVFDRAFKNIKGVAYFSYGWIFPESEARRKGS